MFIKNVYFFNCFEFPLIKRSIAKFINKADNAKS